MPANSRKLFLLITALVEAATGLGLLFLPAIVFAVLLGLDHASIDTIFIGRLAGAALFAIGIAKGGTGVLKVDGNAVVTQKQPNSIAFLQVADETFDVGVDTRTSVNEKDYQVPFAFNGKIDKLTVKLGPMQLSAVDQLKVREATARAGD